MKSWIRWTIVVTGILAVTLVLLGRHFLLDSASLDRAIKTEIPVGAPKDRVVKFIEKRHPVAYDDTGAQLIARLRELPESAVCRRDFVITFAFSPDGKLVSYSTTVFLACL